ncbi:uncharacterized protein N7506_005287 [Penicillium brevicompactum]|uniref:uncharacterized protein n=1 Tax=Penicillium brevicompactum TaxID=5074 RepID=UPI0025410DE5|nr:uncharacterized protein N7506_005287 [Penicillium brevicompactum]KAJ5337265.1 hypothetical protein N7506_005287 [Penicillium brevicompactum]
MALSETMSPWRTPRLPIPKAAPSVTSALNDHQQSLQLEADGNDQRKHSGGPRNDDRCKPPMHAHWSDKLTLSLRERWKLCGPVSPKRCETDEYYRE